MIADLTFGLVAGGIIFGIMGLFHRAGLYKRHIEGGPRWNWYLFATAGLVVFVLEIFWP